MTNLLVRLFIKNSEDVKSVIVRKKYGYLAGGVGIFCNLFLFAIKFVIGASANSIAITVDAFNNLSDAGSSITTIIGFHLTAKPPDKEHPFGHGRFEYIATLVIAAMVLYVGVQFLEASFNRIFNPESIHFTWFGVGVLVLSILIKGWMAFFNKNIGKKISSKTMEATALDSLSDVASTIVVMCSYVMALFFKFPVDGYIGILVSIFILYNGYKITKETISPLLGEAPDPELVDSILNKLSEYEHITGSHDLIVHNYGPGRCIATVHAEIPDNIGIIEAHDTIDNAEKEISGTLGIELIIHMDPVNITDPEVLEIKSKLSDIIKKTDHKLDFHDFRIIRGITHTSIIFDLVMQNIYSNEEEKFIIDSINKQIKFLNKDYNCIITVDRIYN